MFAQIVPFGTFPAAIHCAICLSTVAHLLRSNQIPRPRTAIYGDNCSPFPIEWNIHSPSSSSFSIIYLRESLRIQTQQPTNLFCADQWLITRGRGGEGRSQLRRAGNLRSEVGEGGGRGEEAEKRHANCFCSATTLLGMASHHELHFWAKSNEQITDKWAGPILMGRWVEGPQMSRSWNPGWTPKSESNSYYWNSRI